MKNTDSTLLIWDKGKHNAFTDLCAFNGELWCCFREANSHLSKDGFIRILRLNAQGKIQHQESIRAPNADLRDPKISISASGQLLLLAYRVNAKTGVYPTDRQPVYWVRNKRGTWSKECSFGSPGWWLWRVRWYQNKFSVGQKMRPVAYGFAYNRSMECLKFYSGDPLRTFSVVNDSALSKATHNLGYPNESDLFFIENKCFAVTRRDADTYTAQLGESVYPFKNWKWTDLGIYIGGPCTLPLTERIILVSGRLWQNQKFKTALWLLDLRTKKLLLHKILPSAGDNSYPGLAILDNYVYLSYYSSHKYSKSCIFLTSIEKEDFMNY